VVVAVLIQKFIISGPRHVKIVTFIATLATIAVSQLPSPLNTMELLTAP